MKQQNKAADDEIRKDLNEKFLTPDHLGFRAQLSKIVNNDENQEEEIVIDSRECWQCDPHEFPIKASARVSIFTQLPNGLTAYELMYGHTDSDTRYSHLEK